MTTSHNCINQRDRAGVHFCLHQAPAWHFYYEPLSLSWLSLRWITRIWRQATNAVSRAWRREQGLPSRYDRQPCHGSADGRRGQSGRIELKPCLRARSKAARHCRGQPRCPDGSNPCRHDEISSGTGWLENLGVSGTGSNEHSTGSAARLPLSSKRSSAIAAKANSGCMSSG